jgi:UDP-N-acetylmuramyl pentapeptide phosphotransferase/UDP-N-acetylglucosamine-1-phosphate transferase
LAFGGDPYRHYRPGEKGSLIMIWAGLVLVVGLAAAVTSFATGMALEFLKQKDILDHPNERSSHVVPTPRGGGLGVIPVLILAFVLIALFVADRGVLAVAALGAGALAWVSWQNDIEEIPQFIRLSLHFAVAGMALNLAPLPGLVFQGLLPSVVDLALATILWVWFINLFNFMDGIDGISGVETALIGVGLAGLAIIGGKFGFALPGLVLIGAALGFLRWNWHKAKIFLGDIGSIPLGFLLGYLLLEQAAVGEWRAALILPLYYLVDATFTLLRRAVRGEKFWLPHRQHFYQQAVQRGWRHDQVALLILLAGAILVGLALASLSNVIALGGAVFTVFLLLLLLGGVGKSK